MKLPGILYVRVEGEGDGQYLLAHRELAATMDDQDGPTEIGTYHLVDKTTMAKRLIRVRVNAPKGDNDAARTRRTAHASTAKGTADQHPRRRRPRTGTRRGADR